MPQDGRSADEKKAKSRPDTRSPAEKALFLHMLKNVNLLYLGCSVLCLIDISYLSRFWTQFEAWLSMQAADSTGLHPAPARTSAAHIQVHSQRDTGNEDEKLRQMWATRKPAEAKEPLAMPDVTVTNASDKETQLVKIAKLDEEAQAVFTAAYAGQLKATGVAVAKLVEDGFTPAQGGWIAEEIHAGWRCAMVAVSVEQACVAAAAVGDCGGGFSRSGRPCCSRGEDSHGRWRAQRRRVRWAWLAHRLSGRARRRSYQACRR